MPINDNESAASATSLNGSDDHGRAALLLVESLIHGLRETSALTADEAVHIVERAADVQFDQAEAADGAGAPLWRSHALLTNIVASLRIDGDDGPTMPRLLP